MVYSSDLCDHSVEFAALSPSVKSLLELLLVLYGLHLLYTLHFSLPLLPCVCYAGIFRRVLDTDLLALVHVLVLNVQAEGSERDLVRISDFLDITYALGMDILLSASRESINEGEVALMYSLGRYAEIFLRLVRDVVLGIWCRIVVLVSIDTEH